MKADQPAAARIAILASGNGSNLQAILERVASGELPVTPALVITDVPGARALQRAATAGVATRVIAPGDFPDRAAWNQAIAAALKSANVSLVVLAGFMRIIGAQVLEDFPGKVLNIHPSLLPRYPGLNTYQRVLAAGDNKHGTSVHFVTEELDAGPVIAQVVLPIREHDDEQSLRQRVLAAEHWLYSLVIGWLATGRVEMRSSGAWLDGKVMDDPVRFSESGPP